jgi:hypothetical protein
LPDMFCLIGWEAARVVHNNARGSVNSPSVEAIKTDTGRALG